MSLVDKAREDQREHELEAALNTALRQLRKAKARNEDLVAAVYRATADSLIAQPALRVPEPKLAKSKGKPENALWHLTDWQGTKVTPSYNTAVLKARVAEFCDRSQRITQIQRADHPIPECTVLFGGDMLEGLWNYPTQAWEVDASIFEQWTTVSRLLVYAVQRALADHARVTVVAEWGNHGRIGSKRDGVPRSDNFDRMCYEAARMMLGDQPRLTWNDSAEDIQRVEIGNYRALSMHGDETGRNGYVSVTTFMGYLAKLKSGGFGWDFRDVYTGHRHTHGSDQFADGYGMWYRTGSTESDNRYARDGLGVAGMPSQRLHFIDPDKGRVTSEHKIELA